MMRFSIFSRETPLSPAGWLKSEKKFGKKIAALWRVASEARDSTTFFTDSFMEVDRGYYRRSGIIDRLGNPLPGWHYLMANNSK